MFPGGIAIAQTRMRYTTRSPAFAIALRTAEVGSMSDSEVEVMGNRSSISGFAFAEECWLATSLPPCRPTFVELFCSRWWWQTVNSFKFMGYKMPVWNYGGRGTDKFISVMYS